MQWESSTEPDLTKHKEIFKSRLSQMYAILAKQEDWTLTSMTLLECMIQVPEENLLQWHDRTEWPPRFLTDESVRWLAQNDKKEEAKRILLKIAKRNKRVLGTEQGQGSFCCLCWDCWLILKSGS